MSFHCPLELPFLVWNGVLNKWCLRFWDLLALFPFPLLFGPSFSFLIWILYSASPQRIVLRLKRQCWLVSFKSCYCPPASLQTVLVAVGGASPPDCILGIWGVFCHLIFLYLLLMHFANLVSCFVCFYSYIWRKFNNSTTFILLESLFLNSNIYEAIKHFFPYKIFNLDIVHICNLITYRPHILFRKDLSN